MFKFNSDKRKLTRYYKRKLYGGRTAAARAIDFITLRLVAFAALYLWFSTILDNTVLIMLMSIVALLSLCVIIELVGSIRLERFIKRERIRLAERAFTQKLLMMSGAEYLALIRSYLKEHRDSCDNESAVWPLRQTAKLSEDTLIKLARRTKARGFESAIIFSLSQAEDGALASVERYSGVKFTLIGAPELTSCKESAVPADDELDALLLDEIRAEADTRKKIAAEPFKASRVRRYILVGAGLFALSFFVEYSLYYRLLAGACVSFGALAWWVSGAAPASQQAK